MIDMEKPGKEETTTEKLFEKFDVIQKSVEQLIEEFRELRKDQIEFYCKMVSENKRLLKGD